MTGPVGPVGPPAGAAPNSAHARLRQAAHDLEGVFVGELFKAMRATVPEGGILNDSPGQDLFQGMMDDRIADLYAGRSPGGLGEALYRQLSRRLPDEGTRP